MRYLVAVSGGIDSIVLLHKLVETGKHELVVAHFDHGIRTDSADDARFVEGLANLYQLPFVTKREDLGVGASEDQARIRRHAFLRSEAQKMEAVIVTAHHADDVIETIAINLTRGTGWRGLGIMNQPGIARPLLELSKQEIRDYALRHHLEWVEDSTNMSDNYLRNRLRLTIGRQLSLEKKHKVLHLWQTQLKLRYEIEREAQGFMVESQQYSRYFFCCIDAMNASELLRSIILQAGFSGPTRPQLERALLAIKVAKPGTTQEIGLGTRLFFYERTFIVRTP
jgi:tRNA(Ile)-lysidine synthetase-like protein